jgi:hypothetical protein
VSPTARSAKPKPVPPWKRAEPGVYQSSDDRFSIQSEGPSRWFITDEQQHDELGLARTVGPFDTLDAAKAGAEALRDEAPATSPLAGRLAKDGASLGRGGSRAKAKPEPAEPKPPPPPPKTWLDKLEDDDREAARHARRLIATLEDEGIADADALVRRDITGNQPVIAARLLAREILTAVGTATKPASVVEAVVEALGSSKVRRGLPGWELLERDGPNERERVIRLVPRDLRDATKGRDTG